MSMLHNEIKKSRVNVSPRFVPLNKLYKKSSETDHTPVRTSQFMAPVSWLGYWEAKDAAKELLVYMTDEARATINLFMPEFALLELTVMPGRYYVHTGSVLVAEARWGYKKSTFVRKYFNGKSKVKAREISTRETQFLELINYSSVLPYNSFFRGASARKDKLTRACAVLAREDCNVFAECTHNQYEAEIARVEDSVSFQLEKKERSSLQREEDTVRITIFFDPLKPSVDLQTIMDEVRLAPVAGASATSTAASTAASSAAIAGSVSIVKPRIMRQLREEPGKVLSDAAVPVVSEDAAIRVALDVDPLSLAGANASGADSDPGCAAGAGGADTAPVADSVLGSVAGADPAGAAGSLDDGAGTAAVVEPSTCNEMLVLRSPQNPLHDQIESVPGNRAVGITEMDAGMTGNAEDLSSNLSVTEDVVEYVAAEGEELEWKVAGDVDDSAVDLVFVSSDEPESLNPTMVTNTKRRHIEFPEDAVDLSSPKRQRQTRSNTGTSTSSHADASLEIIDLSSTTVSPVSSADTSMEVIDLSSDSSTISSPARAASLPSFQLLQDPPLQIALSDKHHSIVRQRRFHHLYGVWLYSDDPDAEPRMRELLEAYLSADRDRRKLRILSSLLHIVVFVTEDKRAPPAFNYGSNCVCINLGTCGNEQMFKYFLRAQMQTMNLLE